jgi:hypothetical protein
VAVRANGGGAGAVPVRRGEEDDGRKEGGDGVKRYGGIGPRVGFGWAEGEEGSWWADSG